MTISYCTNGCDCSTGAVAFLLTGQFSVTSGIEKGCLGMNNHTNNFDDVPSGESISYEHLLFYLEQGREIEFVYQEKEYFISNSSQGRAMWTGQTRISEYFGERHKDIVNFKIDGISLVDLFKRNKVKITTIF